MEGGIHCHFLDHLVRAIGFLKKTKKIWTPCGIELGCGLRSGYITVKTLRGFIFLFLLEIRILSCKVFVGHSSTSPCTPILF